MMDKIPVKEIKLVRAEGPIKERGEKTVHSLHDARHQLTTWGTTAPEQGQGYDRCDVEITWENGESFIFRFNLNKGGTSGGSTLQGTLLLKLKIYAGVSCPEHLKPHWEDYLKSMPKDFISAMTRIYQTCEV